MKLPGFLGGNDEQRSLNLSDNRLVNLYPTTNDSGQIGALYKTDGLKLEVTLSGVATGAYKASNGRAFYIAGATLYELTAALASVSRGTVTAGTYDFSDNGIELICVNGTNGWLLTFATNALRQIKVKRATCTVTAASPAVVSATAHTLILGDRLRFSSTGVLPAGLLPSTTYFVISAGLTADAFEVSLTSGGAAINCTDTGTGTHTFTSLGYGFPEGCRTITYINGRFVACEPNTQNFYGSEVLDGGYWDVLNVQTSDSNPDDVVTQIVSHNELIIFNELSGEVFYDSGTIPSPFVRNVSGIFEVGCVAERSVVKIDNSIMWLGQSTAGRGIVYRLNGYTPMRISTYAIEYAIQGMADITDAVGFSYQKDGHHFYVLTFPTGDRTFVFDVNTNLWHERASFADGAFTRWQANKYFYFAGKHMVTDYAKAKIYSLDFSTYTYGTAYNKVVRSFLAPSSDMKRVRHSKLQFDIEVGIGNTAGSDPLLMLRWSDDGGHTWSTVRTMSLGKIGEYPKRVIYYRLGMTRGMPRIYELSCTEDVKLTLLGAYLD